MKNNVTSESHVRETFGIYTITELMDYRSKDGHLLYKGICNECGHEKIARYSAFQEITEKCTHLNILGEQKEQFSFTNERLRSIFKKMIDRCYNENCKDYRWYGAKGVSIYEEWLRNPSLFEKWALSNGYKNNLTIDRKNSNKDYCPENCRWITGSNNSKYKSTTRLIEVDGETHTGREWADILDIGTNVINTMLRKFSEEQVKEFIRKREKDKTIHPTSNQSWMKIYGII